MRERGLRDRVCRDALHRHGVPSLQLTLHTNAGWPDRVFFIPGGRPLLLEFKRPGETPEPLQMYRLGVLHKLGYDAAWVDNYPQAMELICRSISRRRRAA